MVEKRMLPGKIFPGATNTMRERSSESSLFESDVLVK